MLKEAVAEDPSLGAKIQGKLNSVKAQGGNMSVMDMLMFASQAQYLAQSMGGGMGGGYGDGMGSGEMGDGTDVQTQSPQSPQDGSTQPQACCTADSSPDCQSDPNICTPIADPNQSALGGQDPTLGEDGEGSNGFNDGTFNDNTDPQNDSQFNHQDDFQNFLSSVDPSLDSFPTSSYPSPSSPVAYYPEATSTRTSPQSGSGGSYGNNPQSSYYPDYAV